MEHASHRRQTLPTFPNAQVLRPARELEHAKNPTDRDRASYIRENFDPIEAAGQWHLLDDDAAEIIPASSVVRLPRHTLHMQGVLITGGGNTFVFSCDLLPTSAHLHIPG